MAKGALFPAERGGHMEQKVFGQAVHFHMPYSETRLEHVRPRLPVTHWASHDLRWTARTMLASRLSGICCRASSILKPAQLR